MAHALNLTLKLKQDPETKATLATLKEIFAAKVQPAIEKALRESQIVHFARVLVIDDQYIQVITEYDGDKQAYTEFFREKLPEVFKLVFGMAEGAPPWDQMSKDKFYQFSRNRNIKALGVNDDPNEKDEGYLFSAYGNNAVAEILPKLQ